MSLFLYGRHPLGPASPARRSLLRGTFAAPNHLPPQNKLRLGFDNHLKKHKQRPVPGSHLEQMEGGQHFRKVRRRKRVGRQLSCVLFPGGGCTVAVLLFLVIIRRYFLSFPFRRPPDSKKLYDNVVYVGSFAHFFKKMCKLC